MTDCIGVDIDLRKMYAWHSRDGMIVNGTDDIDALATGLEKYRDVLTLAEIAGPVDYSDNKAIAHNKRRWTIYNVSVVARLESYFPTRLLVSPSSDWTSGYTKTVRHKLAKATAKNHDLRECQAMIWSHRVTPSKWRPLSEFLSQL